MKFKCKVTEEVIQNIVMCGKDGRFIIESCLFAYMYNQLIPNVLVCQSHISFKKTPFENNKYTISKKIEDAIHLFDIQSSIDQRRENFLGKEYELEIPDEVIDFYFSDHVQVAQKLINNQILKPVYEI